MSLLYSLIFLLSLILFPVAKTEANKEGSSSKERPLVLQWEVSHPRNKDQISLIFRKEYVELVTNTSSYQKEKVVLLGQFKSPLTSELKKLKNKIKLYYIQLQKTVPVSSLIKDSRFQQASAVNPHAPVLRINEEEIKDEQAYFSSLSKVIYKVWKHKWICMECASYKKQKKNIIRTVKKLKSKNVTSVNIKGSGKAKEQWETSTQKFPIKIFNCVSVGKSKIECIDPKFGIFKI